ncbi:MAG TPA: 16S rRNA (guanine(527)-N(7))-methyltransferase RsmG [Tepidisphaeraceae bacterium]|jgi:16S rRNA (guanine527-N7)-methyltransferase
MSQELWNTLAQRAGLTLDERQHALLNTFLDLLLEANQRMNLTRITDRQQAEILHVADAMTLLPHLPARRHRVADVGSGGGIPGIILAIVRPDAHVVLIESTQKKTHFLRSTATELKLGNIDIEPVRAEEVARLADRESFDIAVARAVATMPELAEWLLPLVKVGGFALAMKGPKGREELQQAQHLIQRLGGNRTEIVSADLPDRPGHIIIKIAKNKPTHPRFPRPGGQAGSDRI